jgi:hypothetical protein
MDKVPDESKYWYKVREMLAVKKEQANKQCIFFPLGKPLYFKKN